MHKNSTPLAKRIFNIIRFSGLVALFAVVIVVFSVFSIFSKATDKIKKAMGLKQKGEALVDPSKSFIDEVWAEGCPYVYGWNGSGFARENDALMAPRGNCFAYNLADARWRYENGFWGGSDLLKLTNVKKDSANRIKIQITEEEPEEGFFDRVRLFKTAHPAEYNIYATADYSGAFEASRDAEKNAARPHSIKVNGRQTDSKTAFEKGLKLERGENAELEIGNINPGKEYLALVRTELRGWSPESLTILNMFPGFLRYGIIGGASLIAYFMSGNIVMPILPFIMLQGGSKSIHFSYLKNGKKIKFGTVHPRLDEATEALVMPKEAILADGTVKLSLDWTREHRLLDVRLVAMDKVKSAELIECELKSAVHSREGNIEVRNLQTKDGNFTHLIQGDSLEIEFGDGKPGDDRMAATYFLSTDGFYTSLRPQYRSPIRNFTRILKEKISV